MSDILQIPKTPQAPTQRPSIIKKEQPFWSKTATFKNINIKNVQEKTPSLNMREMRDSGELFTIINNIMPNNI